jgi:hypothetical protein
MVCHWIMLGNECMAMHAALSTTFNGLLHNRPQPDEFTEGCVANRRSLRSYLRKKLL